MVRRKAEVLTVEKRQGALIEFLCRRIRGKSHQDASAFAVDTKILGAACGNQAFRYSGGDLSGSGGIGVQPVAEPLIGNIDHRGGTGILQHLYHRVPLFRVQVGTRRIVTAAVQ